MNSQIASLIAGILLIPISSLLATAHTPPPGSEERKAICDALRTYLAERATQRLPQAIVFKVDILRVDGPFAWFEGIPLFKDGSATTDYLADQGYTFILHSGTHAWNVIHDLSRSDVPADSELTQLRKELRAVPSSVIPDFWRQLLKR